MTASSILKVCVTTSVLSLLTATTTMAETTDFGGFEEKFKGGGDKIPPQCQIDLPKAATEPFFVKWNCIDDNADADQIRTELWMFRKDSAASELVANFLGFPAAAQITAETLHATDFKQGLPVKFRLLAKDRAGITALSPYFSVSSQDTSLDTCTLSIQTEATASTGDTTGVPASAATLTDVAVTTAETADSKVQISTKEATAASTCEITSVCEDDSKVSFDAILTIATDNTVSGSISVSPGSVLAEVTGTSTAKGVTLSSVEASGTTTIDGASATVKLSCQQ